LLGLGRVASEFEELKARFGFVEAPPIFAATQITPSINFDAAKLKSDYPIDKNKKIRFRIG
jgi:hypothetical protein